MTLRVRFRPRRFHKATRRRESARCCFSTFHRQLVQIEDALLVAVDGVAFRVERSDEDACGARYEVRAAALLLSALHADMIIVVNCLSRVI